MHKEKHYNITQRKQLEGASLVESEDHVTILHSNRLSACGYPKWLQNTGDNKGMEESRFNMCYSPFAPLQVHHWP
jgi:hypothetical protein